MIMLESTGILSFIAQKFVDFLSYTGFANLEWGNLIMIAVGAVTAVNSITDLSLNVRLKEMPLH